MSDPDTSATEEPEFTCPCCKTRAYTVWKLPKFVLLHWVLNPGIALVELLMGACVPKEVFLCERCPGTLDQRSYVACRGCGAFHSGTLWTGSNGLGHWLGYVCPDCGDPIPRLWNATSLLVLGVTAPLWWLPVRHFRKRWLASARRRVLAHAGGLEPKSVAWNRVGVLRFGLVMWAAIALGVLLTDGPVGLLLTALPMCLLGGLAWGQTMKWFMSRRNVHVGPSPVSTQVDRRIGTGDKCPYCHAAVGQDTATVACTQCFARHHDECWDAHTECAACGGTTRFAGVEETQGRIHSKPDQPEKDRG